MSGLNITPVAPTFRKYNYEEILTDFLQSAFAWGLISDDSKIPEYVAAGMRLENSQIMEYTVYAGRLATWYSNADKIYKARSLKDAEGDDLDNILDGIMERRKEDYAIVDLVFSTELPADTDYTIPAGTKIGSKRFPNIIFQTTYETILYTGESSVTIPSVCLTVGPGGNVSRNDLEVIIRDIPGISTVTNPLGATGGCYAESDKALKARARNWRYSLIKGTPDAVIDAITSVNSVRSYYIDRFWRGYGSTRIIIDPPSPTVIGYVTEALESQKAVDEDIIVVPVVEKTVDITCQVNVSIDNTAGMTDSDKDFLETQIEYCLRTYIDGGFNIDGTSHEAMGIGDDFIPFQACKYVAEQLPVIKDMYMTYPTSPVTILAHERAKSGNITVSIA